MDKRSSPATGVGPPIVKPDRFYVNVNGLSIMDAGEEIITFKDRRTTNEHLETTLEVLQLLCNGMDLYTLEVLKENELLDSSDIEKVIDVYNAVKCVITKTKHTPDVFSLLESELQALEEFEMIHYDGLDEDQVVNAQHKLNCIVAELRKQFDKISLIKDEFNK